MNLGAKFISAILQMLIVFGVSCAAVAVSTAGAVLTIGGLSDFLEMVQMMSESFVRGGLHWGDLVSLTFLMFLSWTLIIMTGFLAVILARTILIRSAGGEKAECVNECCGLRCQQKQMLWCYPARI